jgi:hypothetical protein
MGFHIQDCVDGPCVQGGGYTVHMEDGHVHLAKECGDLTGLDGGVLVPGHRRVGLSTEALADYRPWLLLSAHGVELAWLESVALPGPAPLSGIDIGVDRRSPVQEELYEGQGAFAHDRLLHAVTYARGARATYLPGLGAHATGASTRVYDSAGR